MQQGMDGAFGSCKRVVGNWSSRIKLIFSDMIQGEKQRNGEGTPCWAASRNPRALEITVAKSVWKLEEAERGGTRAAGPGAETW